MRRELERVVTGSIRMPRFRAGRAQAADTQEGFAVIAPSVILDAGRSRPRDLIIEGRIAAEVSLHGHNVSIGERGSVDADLYGSSIRVAGQVRGNLFGEVQVVIRRSGSVRGNITAPSVILEDGADFKGSIEMAGGLGYNGGRADISETDHGVALVSAHRLPARAQSMSSDEQPESRGAIRVEQRLEIQYASDCPPIKAQVQDLSETGMYLDTDQALPAGSVLEFELRLPDAEAATPVKGSAVVVWSGPTGMGVEFRELDEAVRERLRYFVAAVHFRQPTDLPGS